MAPGAIKNSDTVINNTIEAIARDEGLISEVVKEVKACPIDHLVLKDVKQNGAIGKDGVEIQITKLDKKQSRKVTRPKVLKNIESNDHLYDRLYDTACPRVVSRLFFKLHH